MTITKKFHINNGFDADIEYEVSTCTAIPVSIGETERIEALYVHYYAESGEHVEHVVFNWEMPEDEDEFLAMCEDHSAWDGYFETLRTVDFGDEYIVVISVSGWETGSGFTYTNNDIGEFVTNRSYIDRLIAEKLSEIEWSDIMFTDDMDLDALADDSLSDTLFTLRVYRKSEYDRSPTLADVICEVSRYQSEVAKELL